MSIVLSVRLFVFLLSFLRGLFFLPHVRWQLRAPRRLRPRLCAVHRAVVYCKGRFLLPHSCNLSSLFHQNRSDWFAHSISGADRAASCSTLLPVRQSYQQTSGAARHCSCVLFSTSCFVRCWLIRYRADQTSSAMATTTG